VSIPDYISPIVGYRVWTWDTKGLKSLCGERWHPNQSLTARCRASAVVGTIASRVEGHDSHDAPQVNCTCGIYAVKTLHHFRSAGYERYGVHGEVYLWGTVVEHELGWRAQFAYPKSLVLPPEMDLLSPKEVDARLKALASYGIDIFIDRDKERIPLCRRSSGFDAAGIRVCANTRSGYTPQTIQAWGQTPAEREGDMPGLSGNS
jgi:hypothetical protein